jgi:hypothetical protein
MQRKDNESEERHHRVNTDLIAADDEESTDGRKDDTDDEESRKDGLGCQNGLPSLQPLLFESGIYVKPS